MNKNVLNKINRKNLIVLLLLINLLFITHGVYATTPLELRVAQLVQTKSVTINSKNLPLKKILYEIQKQTGISFIIKDEKIVEGVKFSLQVKDAKVKDALEKLLTGTQLTYKVTGNVVTILKQEKPQSQPMKEIVRKVNVRGKVLDDNKEPIVGATILVQGTTKGAFSDAKGQFNLVANTNDILEISFVGKTMIVYDKPLSGTGEIVISMKSDALGFEDVVVTGMFNKKKESYTGAVTTIDSKQIKEFGSRDILTTLRNIDPSFNLLENNAVGSNPNALPELQVRGVSSLPDVDQLIDDTFADLNSPLIILDGFEISLRQLMDMNSDEINQISLLKDAAATSIYGSRGANGVVVVTTKLPESGKLSFSYTGGLTIDAPDLTAYNLLNAAEKLELERQVGFYDGSDPKDEIDAKKRYYRILNDVKRGVDTYWLSKPLRVGTGQRHNATISGGTKEFRYSVTGQYNHTAGAMKGSDRNTFNATIMISYNYKKITLRNSASLGLVDGSQSPYGRFSDYTTLNPYWAPYNDKGKLVKNFMTSGGGTVANPLHNAGLNIIDKDKTQTLRNNFSLEWRPAKGLTLSAKLGVTKGDNEKDKFTPPEHSRFETMGGDDIVRKGTYDYRTGSNFSYNLTGNVNYSKTFAEKHQVYGGVNFDMQESENSSYSFNVEGFGSGKMDFLGMAIQYPEGSKPSGSENRSRRVGFVANMNYSYDTRYFIDGSFSTDGSSQFGSKRRFGHFWSVGVGWNIQNEQWMKSVKSIDLLKLRASIGTTGANRFRAYETSTVFTNIEDDYYLNWLGVTQKNLPNPELEWQKTVKYNIGLETGFVDNRLKVSMDIYQDKTEGLISTLNLPFSSGFTSYRANVGSVGNKGFEIRTSFLIIRDNKRKINWSVTAGIDHNSNKILKLSEAMRLANEEIKKRPVAAGKAPSRVFEAGESQHALFVRHSLGIDPSNGEELFVKDGGGITYEWDEAKSIYSGESQAKFRGNLNSIFRYKDFSLSISFGYFWGSVQYNQTLVTKVENANLSLNVDKRVMTERWINPGDKTFFKGIKNKTTTNQTSRLVQNESVLRCQNIGLEYRAANKKWLKAVGLKNMSFRVNLADVFYISTIKRERGTDYPFAYNITGSLSLMF